MQGQARGTDHPPFSNFLNIILGLWQLGVLEKMAARAGDAKEALPVFESNSAIALLITDVGLPGGMNGRQLAEAVRQERPDLEVLFITGYANNAVFNHGHLERACTCWVSRFRWTRSQLRSLT